MKAKTYLMKKAQIETKIELLKQELRHLKNDVKRPTKHRLATAADIKVGAIIFYRIDEAGWYWHEIIEVLHPNDDFKAYTAEDGCRYGLDKASVEL